MGFISKFTNFFSHMADKFTPSATPMEGLIRQKKEKGGLYKEIAKIVVMMGGGAITGSIVGVLGIILLVLIVPFVLFQILFFPIAAPLTIIVLSLIIGVISQRDYD